jgi:hypothetical protein
MVRTVEDEIWILPPCFERILAVAGPFDSLEVFGWNYLIGINVGAVKRDCLSLDSGYCFHARTSLTSVK